MPSSSKKVVIKDAIKNLDKAISYKTTALDQSVKELHSDMIAACETIKLLSDNMENLNQKFYGVSELAESIIDSKNKRDSYSNMLDLKGSSKIQIDESVETCVKPMCETENKSEFGTWEEFKAECENDKVLTLLREMFRRNQMLEERLDSMQFEIDVLKSKVLKNDDTNEDSRYMKTADYD